MLQSAVGRWTLEQGDQISEMKTGDICSSAVNISLKYYLSKQKMGTIVVSCILVVTVVL